MSKMEVRHSVTDFTNRYGDIGLIWPSFLSHVIIKENKVMVYHHDELYSDFNIAQTPKCGIWVIHGVYTKYPSITSTITYYEYGLIHREDGPASIHTNSRGFTTQDYVIDGKRHREDGPAYIETDAKGEILELKYFINGELHREDGPAYIKWPNVEQLKIEEWYYRGKKYDPLMTKAAR